ncbi:MAG: hypothetical protein CVV41_21925 [Candidatus Riflebacteria bacterium HGW-Riflebacteria-1]|jgi:hypothetical protein|nr:MAG: hypothetical protein CVV41_21925 [Candidatus Riflebacteria bacterium HGW-Riflebacteria-1]
MIVSVSRRTDIPAFYQEWFFNRLAAGFAMTRNPMNPSQVRRVDLTPAGVDCFVFWSKNPVPLLPKLDRLRDYKYYFQFTLTPYEHDLEPGLPAKDEIVATFKELSAKIGAERVVWRYDPIVFTDRYDLHYHSECFEWLCSQLAGFTERCVISFYDHYNFITRNLKGIQILPADSATIRQTAERFAEIAGSHRLILESCAEKENLDEFGIAHGRCIDDRLINRICGRDLQSKRDHGQRPLCGCVKSVDIGAYATCLHGCRYCYAARQRLTPSEIKARHNPDSPFLVGGLDERHNISLDSV